MKKDNVLEEKLKLRSVERILIISMVAGLFFNIWNASVATPSQIIERLAMPPDIVSYEKRLQPLRHLLSQVGSVGYATNRIGEDLNSRLYYVEYALLPLKIVIGSSLDNILCDFTTDQAFHDFIASGSYIVLDDLKDGIALVKRKSNEGRKGKLLNQ